jgi:hypothetical protein
MADRLQPLRLLLLQLVVLVVVEGFPVPLPQQERSKDAK